MAEGENVSLSAEQRRALLVLGSLFLRMGQFTRAKKLFAALSALDRDDAWTARCLAVAHLGLNEGEKALEQLDRAIGNSPLPSRDAALHLLRARALWMNNRPDEAKNAVNAWIAAGGGRS